MAKGESRCTANPRGLLFGDGRTLHRGIYGQNPPWSGTRTSRAQKIKQDWGEQAQSRTELVPGWEGKPGPERCARVGAARAGINSA